MSRTKNVKYYLAIFVALITFVVYLHTLQNDFVELDDNAYVFENSHIRTFDIPFLRWAFLGYYACNWHPLTWISHAADYAAWGLNPVGHHLTNIIIHAVNTFIVVFLVMRLMGSLKGTAEQKRLSAFFHERTTLLTAGIAGTLFGLHPLHVESAAWISERKDLLCAFFFLLSTTVYMKYASTLNNGPTQKKLLLRFFNRHYLSAVGLFVLALLSKPMAVTLPVVLLILDWYPLYRIYSLKTLWSGIIEKLPFFTLSLISSILTMLAQKKGGALVPITFVPLSARVPVAAKSLIVYLWKMAVPLNLIPYYPYPENASFLSFEYSAAAVLIIGITTTCIVVARKQRLWLAAWCYYVITLLPVIGIVQVGGQAMADRYTYLPSLGPFIIFGITGAWLVDDRGPLKKGWIMSIKNVIGMVMVFSMFVSLTYLTFKQIGVWKNSLVILNYILEKQPNASPHVYLYRGIALEKAGKIDRAIEDYNMAITLNPSYSDAYNYRGFLYKQKGLINKAIEDFNKAIALSPSSEKAYYNLGVIYSEAGLFDQAIREFNNSIAADPEFADAYANRGVIYALSGRQDKALEDFNKAIELDPYMTDVYFNRGKLYSATGKHELAIADFQKACDSGDQGGCSALRDLRNSLPNQRE